MRVRLILVMGLVVAVGCGDADGMSEGVGGSGGGTGDAESQRAFILYAPLPPCVEGQPSTYQVSVVGTPGLVREVRGTSPQCEAYTLTDRTTFIECDNSGPATDFTMVVDDGARETVELRGTFETCAGFYSLVGDGGAPVGQRPFVDLYMRPDPPCAEGISSTYSVSVLVDGVPGSAENLDFELEGCTGATNDSSNVYSCSNDVPALDYMLRAGEGDTMIQLSGVLETCSAVLFERVQ